jgi:peroxiredoxin
MNMKKPMVAYSLVAAALCILFAFSPAGYELGDSVKDFKLKNVDGKFLSLSEYAPKGAIIIFDCNTCPYSKAYNDRIVQLHKKFKGQGYPVIAINANDATKSPGDSYDEMVSHAKKKSYDFPYLYDESQEVAKSFGATNTPHVFVVKRDVDAYKVAYIGAIDNNTQNADAADKKYVEDAVSALIQGKPITNAKTKAIGCGIKYR